MARWKGIYHGRSRAEVWKDPIQIDSVIKLPRRGILYALTVFLNFLKNRDHKLPERSLNAFRELVVAKWGRPYDTRIHRRRDGRQQLKVFVLSFPLSPPPALLLSLTRLEPSFTSKSCGSTPINRAFISQQQSTWSSSALLRA